MRSTPSKAQRSGQPSDAGAEFSSAIPTQERPPARSRSLGRLSLVARMLGALALLATGAVHLQQFLKLYSEIPTIGTLFVLNFAGATAIGVALLAPLERI